MYLVLADIHTSSYWQIPAQTGSTRKDTQVKWEASLLARAYCGSDPQQRVSSRKAVHTQVYAKVPPQLSLRRDSTPHVAN
eukprot:6140791-Pleurochrysis_carterae.AAC.3